MKRGTVNHPKTCALAAELGVEQWGAAGILASLFEFGQFYAKRGDVGRHSDAAIVRGIGWVGDPAELISALVKTGWLDRCRCHRLRIHDWHEHADQTTRRSEVVKKQGFLECYENPSSLLADDEQNASQPSPSPSPSPSSTPSPSPVVFPPAAPVGDSRPPILVAWSREACDAWIARFGGTAPGGQIGKALKPLVDRHGWSEVATAWRSYLTQTDAEYASPSRFAATYGRWSGTAPPGNARESSADVLRAAVMGGLKGK